SVVTMLERLKKRGRDYEHLESDETLYSYYETLNTRYNQWYEDVDVCPKIQVVGDKFDFVENPDDAKKVIGQIQEKLA
ncbi:deoxynucleoside kinase, partial [Enterococcus faecium]|uniref:deoxynucleoside kinase n=1 Tax=Enterococcus faecium TaxID=1352 RepID=UPI003CC5C09D